MPVSTGTLVILCTLGWPDVSFLAYLKPVHLNINGVPDTMMVLIITYNVSCLLKIMCIYIYIYIEQLITHMSGYILVADALRVI